MPLKMNRILTERKKKRQKEKSKRLFIHITGIVQGVGFRPFIYSLATRFSLSGFVLNDTSGVKIEVEGEGKKTADFLEHITLDAPPLALIEKIDCRKLPPIGYHHFEIKKSKKEKEKFTLISPDISVCPDCLRELFDKADRRYQYPFINCTNCGPRFSIIENIPYDRARTTMREFKLCPECQSEYDDPLNRRFHAQPNACRVCGPRVSLFDNKGRKIHSFDPIKTSAGLLKKGYIVAVKGLGGFHLACDAANKTSVETLRKRKYREDKPFALMALDVEKIKEFCRVNEYEQRLLLSPRRPILILRKKKDCRLPDEIAPNNKCLGMMLPYTPLHYLLLREAGMVLVMTSGNISDEPIAYKNKDAFKKLGGITDYFLVHNRKIQTRIDDSVTRIFNNQEMIIRRSRGYVPQPMKVNFFFKEPVLAVGGELKNTFCLATRNYAFLSHHIGDLENLSALTSFEEGIDHFLRIFHASPRIVACDLHPDYLSTKFAQEYCQNTSFKPELIPVQHHHAHIVSCLIDNHSESKVIGVAFDGVGLGTDRRIWGGEFLVADLTGFTRVAQLKYLPLPGGEMAIKEPWRMAVTYLNGVYGPDFLSLPLPFLETLKKDKIMLLLKIIKKGVNSPLTSSMGRLFDAVSALTGLRDRVNYEGQAAIELEMLVEDKEKGSYPFEISSQEKIILIDPKAIIASVVSDLINHERKEVIAARFHNTIARVILQTCKKIREKQSLNEVALSGGVFQNVYLLEKTCDLLTKTEFSVYTHHQVPPNDGGISLGQAVIAHTRSRKCA